MIMRIFAFLFSCVFLLAGCQTTSDQYGSGPLTLRASVKSGFQQYLKHLKPAHFAVSTDGRYYSYFYCETGCAAGSTSAIDAIKRCENRSNGVPCKLFARQRTIVWQGFDADKDLAMTDYNWKEHVGSGKLSFTSSQKEGFAEYLSRESREYPYGVFAVSRNGGWAYSWSKRRDRATNNAMNNCADFVAGTCKVYAVGDRVVWDGADAEAAADSSAPTITRSNPALPGRRRIHASSAS